MIKTDIFIIGAGVAGISAAKTAVECGKAVAICDREEGFGGVLRQCIHRGFGDTLTGPEYIAVLTEAFPESVDCFFSTTVLEIREDKTALLSSREKGIFEISFSQLILATGCMEISPGMLPIGGTRPEGVYTAGHAQLMSFMGEGFPSPVVILGSGDLGLIMARQLHEQGHEVACIIEKNSAPTAMARNRGILDEVPLISESTVKSVHGEKHIESITLENLSTGEEQIIPCATLLIAAGLRPDRSLVRGMERIPWITYCGNCNKIYPMVEGLAADAKEAAKAVCERNW
jgi:sarcosine oxidase subunit alpha